MVNRHGVLGFVNTSPAPNVVYLQRASSSQRGHSGQQAVVSSEAVTEQSPCLHVRTSHTLSPPQVLKRSGTEQEKMHARRIMPVSVPACLPACVYVSVPACVCVCMCVLDTWLA